MFRRAYFAVRDWTDRAIKDGSIKEAMLAPAIAPILLGAWMFGGATPGERTIRIAPFLLWAVLWVGFSTWRFWLSLRREARKADRHFDIWGKKMLPPEYSDSESATKAKRRRE